MRTQAVINGISSLSSIFDAYDELKTYVSEPDKLEVAMKELVQRILDKNDVLFNVGNSILEQEKQLVLGKCVSNTKIPQEIIEIINEKIPSLIKKERLVVPITLDLSENFLISMNIGQDSKVAKEVVKFLVFELLNQNHSMNIRCVDTVSGGSFFSGLFDLIYGVKSLTGGKVYSDMKSAQIVLDEMDKASSRNMIAVGNEYVSVDEYNQKNSSKLTEYLVILYMNDTFHSREDSLRLRNAIQNRKKTGVRFILLGNEEFLKQFAENADYDFKFLGNQINCGNLEFCLEESIRQANCDISRLKEGLQQKIKVDTLIEHYPQLMNSCLEMNSDNVLRIPFAVDKHGNVQYFEIGGEAPVHALLSGSTGSGKSVLLHSLIMGIVHNYHPDDVEIWAIDYKAVEFNNYIQYRTPHFRVIGYDDSVEFSLSILDLLYEEYNSRMEKFLKAGVKNISEYRRKNGKYSMPRIVVLIDEFQILTQSVQQYVGTKDYRTVLENLLRLTRAMGISFIFSSQTIASGLNGLTDAARDQISCRICLRHDSALEIRETLLLSGSSDAQIVDAVKNLQRGQGYYKRAILGQEQNDTDKKFEFKDIYVLYINDEIKQQMMIRVNEKIANNYTPKDEIIVQGGGRVSLSDKVRHPIEKFIQGNFAGDMECVEWYPAAPTTLADSYRIEVQDAAGANMLVVGEDDELRDSMILHSVCGFLMDPENQVILSVVDENYGDRKRMINLINKIQSKRLVINVGLQETFKCISNLKKIRPVYEGHKIYIWYGLDKLKNEIFLATQDDEIEKKPATPVTKEDMMFDLQNFLAELSGTQKVTEEIKDKNKIELSYEDCKSILLRAFEAGPENNMFHMMIFNNNKGLKKSGLVKLNDFENRIGTKMSSEDSFDLFGSSLAINKTDNNTVIYYAGSGQVVPLRPYLLPSDSWINSYNQVVDR